MFDGMPIGELVIMIATIVVAFVMFVMREFRTVRKAIYDMHTETRKEFSSMHDDLKSKLIDLPLRLSHDEMHSRMDGKLDKIVTGITVLRSKTGVNGSID